MNRKPDSVPPSLEGATAICLEDPSPNLSIAAYPRLTGGQPARLAKPFAALA